MRARVATIAIGGLLAFAIAIAAPPAAAQPSAGDTALATELFNAGRDLLKDGNYSAACPKLAESARLDPKVGTLARLAECEEHLGQLALARGHWQQTLNLARSSGDSRAAHAEGELARIDRLVPKIEIVMSGEPPKDLALKLDSADLGAGSLGVKLPVDPGHHTIRASAPGKTPVTLEIDTQADGVVSRVVVPSLADAAAAPVAPAAPVAEPAPPPAPPTEPRAASPMPWRTIGIVGAVVGVLTISTSMVFGVIAKSKRDDSNKAGCAGDNCTRAAAATRDDARSAGNTATAVFVVGGVLTAAGVTLWLLAPSPRAAAAVRAAPIVARDSVGMALAGSF